MTGGPSYTQQGTKREDEVEQRSEERKNVVLILRSRNLGSEEKQQKGKAERV